MPAGASFSGFQFDDTTKFVFCGDPATLDVHFYCKILNLQTWYTTQTDLRTPFLPGDLYRKFLFFSFLTNFLNKSYLKSILSNR